MQDMPSTTVGGRLCQWDLVVRVVWPVQQDSLATTVQVAVQVAV